MVHFKINGRELEAAPGTSILDAARQHHIHIPTLCHLEGLNQPQACRLCVVEVEGARNLQASCVTKVREGMVIQTASRRVKKARQMIYELILSNHPRECLSCNRNQHCELQGLGEVIPLTQTRLEGAHSQSVYDDSSPSIVRDSSKCVLCRRCIEMCNSVQGVGVLNMLNRGFDSVAAPAFELPLGTVNCTNCGQCTTVCPVDAIKEHDSTQAVWNALFDPAKRVVIQTAPAIRAALGEEFGYEPGTLVTGKMAAALRRMQFDDVFDTNFTADLTILEEGTEFLSRATAVLTGQGQAALPLVTSCSPGWIKFVEHEFPSVLEHISSCKSPHTMMGALVKSFYAGKINTDPKDMFVVSVMPCTAKKFEITRPQMEVNGIRDVDAVLTTRELARMIKDAGVEFTSLPDEQFDAPLGYSSGAADIFGVTGGVMEAALRTVYELVTGRELPFDRLHVQPIVGFERIKTAELTIQDPKPEYSFLNGFTVKVAVTSGLAGARQLMEEIARGESPYHFIEVMGCPGGCISGGGQPRMTTDAVRQKRLEAIYREDEGKPTRKSHENPYVQQLYADFLGSPNSHRAHELLHTTYTARGRYNQYLKDPALKS